MSCNDELQVDVLTVQQNLIGYKMVIVAVCVRCSYVFARATKEENAQVVCDFIFEILSQSWFKSLSLDLASYFLAGSFREMINDWNLTVATLNLKILRQAGLGRVSEMGNRRTSRSNELDDREVREVESDKEAELNDAIQELATQPVQEAELGRNEVPEQYDVDPMFQELPTLPEQQPESEVRKAPNLDESINKFRDGTLTRSELQQWLLENGFSKAVSGWSK